MDPLTSAAPLALPQGAPFPPSAEGGDRDRLMVALARHDGLLDAVLAQLPGALLLVEAPSGQLVYWNPLCETLLGHPMIVAGSVADYGHYGAEHADGRPYAADEYPPARALRGELVDQHHMRYRRPDGSLAHLSVSASPVRDAGGAMTHVVCVFTDASHRYRVEDALRERQERLAAALDASRTGTFRWDIRTNALGWDDNLDRLFGLAPGRTARSLDQFLALVHPDDRERVVRACERCAADGVDFDEEFRVVWPDGTVRWLHDKGRTSRGADGRPAYMTGACVDVTERREQEDGLRTLAETIPQIVWTARPDGRGESFNERWYAYTGFPRPADAALHDGGWHDAVHPDDHAPTLAAWRAAVRTGGPFEAEFRLREGATGRYRWFLSRAHAQRDAAGRVARWFGTCTDVDARVQEAELARRLSRLTALLAGSLGVEDVARLVVGEGVQALGAHAGSLALLADDGVTLELRGVAGDSPEQVNREWARFPLDADVPMAEVVRTGRPMVFGSLEEIAARSPAVMDAARHVGVQAAVTYPLADGGRFTGSLAFVFATGEGLTPAQLRFVEQLAQHCAAAVARARLFEALNAARDEAEQANRAKSDFLRVMSHELRSPLNAIDGHAALMEEEIHGPVTSAQGEALGRIRRSGRALLTLINDLLSYARLEAGRMEFAIAPTALHPLLAGMEGFVAPRMRERDIAYRYVAGAPGVRVDADPDKLQQVLLNLLTNASKFTPAGGKVTLGVDRDDSDGWVRIHVADTGVGIEAEKLESVFEPFVQVDASHTRRREGVGLGLAISRDLARGMGGELSATSQLGRGSVFTVRLRASAEPAGGTAGVTAGGR